MFIKLTKHHKILNPSTRSTRHEFPLQRSQEDFHDKNNGTQEKRSVMGFCDTRCVAQMTSELHLLWHEPSSLRIFWLLFQEFFKTRPHVTLLLAIQGGGTYRTWYPFYFYTDICDTITWTFLFHTLPRLIKVIISKQRRTLLSSVRKRGKCTKIAQIPSFWLQVQSRKVKNLKW